MVTNWPTKISRLLARNWHRLLARNRDRLLPRNRHNISDSKKFIRLSMPTQGANAGMGKVELGITRDLRYSFMINSCERTLKK